MSTTHRYTSHGRTRRPKNITGQDGHQVTGAVNIATLRALSLANGEFTAYNGVYRTENQRFLHLHAAGTDSGCTNVYTYLYATQNWTELMEISGSHQRASIVCGANEHRIIEIAGADLIAFQTGSGGLHAAFSTF